MKRIVIAILVIVGFCGAGYQMLQYKNEKIVIDQLVEQEAQVNIDIEQAKANLSALPISKYSTNSELLSDILATDNLQLVQITAQSRSAHGDYENILSVNSIEEVAYFTNTVSRIALTASYKDFDKAFTYVAEISVPYSAVIFDTENNTVSIFITPVTIGTTDISSEFTEETESTEDATPSTETTASDSITLPETDSSENFDIQYLGGEDNE